MAEEMLTVVDFLRHGECQGGEVFRGATDLALSETGWQQMWAATSPAQPWQQIVSSPLSRCAQFAEKLGQAKSIPVALCDDLREIHFGCWEGRPIAEVWQQQPELIGRYFADPGSVTPQGGEPMDMARRRLASAWRQILREYSGRHLLLVHHGGTIRLLLAHLLQMPLQAVTNISVPYAGLSRLHVYRRQDQLFTSLVFHNGRPPEAAQR